MRRRTKIFLDIIFLLGLLTAGLSIGRAVTTTPATWQSDFTCKFVAPSMLISCARIGYLTQYIVIPTSCSVSCYTSPENSSLEVRSLANTTQDTVTIPGILSIVEIKMGMFFASCPMLRQFFSYVLRERSVLPTSKRNPPNGDFIAMRKRVTLRDILWYRKSDSPKGKTQSSKPRPNQPRDIASHDRRIKFSALDRIWAMLRYGNKPSSVEPEQTDSGMSEKGLVNQRAVSARKSGAVEGSNENDKIGLKAKSSGETFLTSATRTSGDGWSLGTGNNCEGHS